jgi:hypothetical protein
MRTTRFMQIIVALLLLVACASQQTSVQQTEGESPSDNNPETSTQTAPISSGDIVEPSRFEYLGAFRLPGGEDQPLTFAYGGNAMTFNPDGDLTGIDDSFPGSLFLMGHDRMPYGDLPDGN